MADEDVVMFRFANNIGENADEIAAGLTRTIQSIHNAVREAGGTSVPIDFGSDLVKSAQKHADEASAILKKALDPRALSSRASAADVRGEMSKVAVGAFQNIQRDIDKQLAQLGPAAQRALADSGELDRLMDHVAHALVGEVMAGYETLRASFDAQLRQQLPSMSRLGKIESHLGRQVGQQEYYLQPAAEQRAKSLFSTDEEGMEEVNATAYAAAELRAEAARVKAAAAKTKSELGQAQRELSEALADLVGHEDPIAVAMGLRRNPTTGLPARRKGEGFEDITDPRQVTETLAKYEELKRAVSETKRLLASGEVTQIGKSSFFKGTGADGRTQLYDQATTSGVQYLRLLDETETKVLSLRRAEEELRKEQNSPIDKARAEQARQEKALLAEQERADRDAIRRQATDARRVRGFVPGVVQGAFGSGFNATGSLEPGLISANIGKTVGTAARYSLAYGGFYQFLQAMKQGVAIFADYQDSFTDFQVAMGDGSRDTQQMTNDLMDLSVALGENVGAAYDAAARGVRAFASDASAAEKAAAGLATASAAQKVAVIGDKSLTDATGDVISVGSAFGMNAQQTELLLPDWLANAKRNIGGDPTQISQGLSNFAVTANEAGFSGQEAANIIALIQSKTDESGQAVATRLSRITQIVSGSTGKSLAGDVNRALGHSAIDITQNPKRMLEDFSRAYVEAGKKGLTSLQGQIRSQLGGTSNIKELLPLLESTGQDRLAKALDKSIAGAGTSEYERKINTVMGQLKQVQGYIQNLVVLAANADIFAPFAIGVKVLTPTLHLLQSILQVYEKFEGLAGPIAGPLGTTAAEAGLGYLAFQKIRKTALAQDVAGTTGVTGAFTRAAGVAPTAGTAAAEVLAANTAATGANTVAKAQEAAAAEGLIAAEARAQIATNSLAAAFERTGISTLGMGGAISKAMPFLKGFGILAALVAVDKIVANGKKNDQYSSDELSLLGSVGGKDMTPGKIRNNADALDALAAKSKGRGPGYGNYDPDGVTLTKRAQNEAHLMRVMADAGDAEQKRADSLKSLSVFGDAAGRTTDKVTEGFAQLAEQGLGARSSLNAYFNALITKPADIPGSGEMPQTTTNSVLGNLSKGADSYIKSLGGNVAPGGAIGKGFADLFHNSQSITSQMFGAEMPNPFGDNSGDVARTLNLGPQLAGVRKRILAGIKKAGPNMTQAELDKITAGAVNGIDTSRAEGEYADFDRSKFMAAVLKMVRNNVKATQRQIGKLGALSPAELDELVKEQATALQEVDPSDPTAGLGQARTNLQQLLTRRRAGHGATFDRQEIAIRDAREKVQEMAVAEAEDSRQAVEARLGPRASLAQRQAARLGAAIPSYRDAGNNVKLLEQLMESMDRQTVKAILGFRRTAVETAKIAYDKQKQLLNEAQTLLNEQEGGPAMSGHPGPGAGGQDPSHPVAGQAKVDRLRREWIAKQKNLTAAQEAYLRASIPDADMSGGGSAATTKLTAWQQRALNGQALANPNNSISQARHGLDVARANLDAVIKNEGRHGESYFSALQAVTTARQTLASSLADGATAAANLVAAQAGGGAMASARAQVQAAQDQLALPGGKTEHDNALASLASGHTAMRQAAASKIAAIADAGAARIGGGLAQARAGIRGAAANLNAQVRGTGEWWQALSSYYQAQQSMRDAVLAYRNNLDLLRGDSTDPVEQARDALRAAARKLRQDRRRGAGKDVIAEDKVAVDNTDNQYAASKFNQRFSDMQTAEDLGRISFAKYMSYLDHEHDRLTRIKHRTRQQQDELDQVDKAMKDALNSMDSQFNLGDINTNGLVYQVRRFKAEAASQIAPRAAASTTNQTVSISINGADTAKVKTIIDGYLRIQGGQRQALTRRKV